MSRLENELKKALQRKEPSTGFTQRVLNELANPQSKRASSQRDKGLPIYLRLFRQPQLRWVAGVLILGAGIWLAADRYREHQRAIRERETTKKQVLLALHIASSKLNRAHKLVLEKIESATGFGGRAR